MTTPSNPPPTPKLGPGLLIGLIAAFVTIIGFIVIYVLLQNTDLDDATRLLLSFCIPPGVLGIIIGGIFVLR